MNFKTNASAPGGGNLLANKDITANGIYKAVDDGYDGYEQVTVSVAATSGWQPDPLWTDIRTLWDDDTLRKKVASGITFYSDTALTTSVGTLASSHPITSVEATYGTIVGDGTDGTAGTTYYVAIADVTGTYIYSAIHLISASDTSSVFLGTSEFYRTRYITSDGYDSTTELTSDYTHTWDLSQDMIDSNGAYTRWVKVYRESPTTKPYNFNNTVLWCIYNVSVYFTGSTSLNTTYYFSNCKALQCVECESNITAVYSNAFYRCYSLATIKFVNFDCQLDIFKYCYSLLYLTIPHGTMTIPAIFDYCYGIRYIYLPNTLTTLSSSAFDDCYGILKFDLENGFDINLNVSSCVLLSRQNLNAMIAAYKDNSGGTARTLTMGATNLAKLTAEDIAVATAKNLNLA